MRLLLATLLLTISAQAAYKGEVNFTQDEITYHKQTINDLVNTSQSCLERYKAEHERFYKSHCNRSGKCLSKFYGERKYSKKRWARRSDGKFLTYLPKELKRNGFDPSLVNKMEAISCVGLALQCLEEGFKATNQSPQWEKIMRFVRANGVGGTALQDALQNIGWSVHYWNPAEPEYIQEATRRWDEEEKRWQSKGWHNYRYNNVVNRGTYWYNTVDNATDLVGFVKQTPAKLYDYPFWVGTANTGYHVFPGTFGRVVEAHSTRHITSINNLEFSNFNPLAGEGPKWTSSEKYRSGLIALPPL